MLKQLFTIPDKIKNISIVGMFIGLLFASYFAMEGSPERLAHAYLVPFIYFTFLSMGSLFFLSIHHVSKAGWSVNIKRIMESAGAFIPVAFFMALPLFYYGEFMYEWFDSAHVAADPILKNKSPYLNVPFFIIRTCLFFGFWYFIHSKLVKFSRKQDEDGKIIWNEKAIRYSIAFLLLFSLSFSFFSVDFLMSLDSHWFSTIFGVYAFAGAFQSALALIILLTIYFMPKSSGLLNENHIHDLGKYLLGITLFWAYIAFSQYMLIWYANLPEETTFFMVRSKSPWMWVSISLLIFKFAVPFVCLLPRWVKRNTRTLSAICILILIMQYVDIYWLVYPSYSEEYLYWGVIDITFFLGFAGVFIWSLFKFFSKHGVLPSKDPREHESNSHHVTYS